jgi:tRNA U34 5-methylaminomethyl-2-thiouridine-forming methyltransferase MnmC
MYNQKLRQQKKLVECADGTKTLYSCEFDEAYHSSRDGALNESLQKHVIPALRLHQDKSTLHILDICYGLGYNTLATIYYVKQQNIHTKLNIISPEFDANLVKSLKDFEYPKEFESLKQIIQAISNEYYYEDREFKIQVIIDDAREVIKNIDTPIDIIYQDAFSPKVNPMLWTYEYFRDISKLCHSKTVLTTYSTAASTRMALHENGFILHSYQGNNTRKSLIASPTQIPTLQQIDMELKIQRNPTAKSIKDSELVNMHSKP